MASQPSTDLPTAAATTRGGPLANNALVPVAPHATGAGFPDESEFSSLKTVGAAATWMSLAGDPVGRNTLFVPEHTRTAQNTPEQHSTHQHSLA